MRLSVVRARTDFTDFEDESTIAQPTPDEAAMQKLAIAHYTAVGHLIEEIVPGSPLCFLNYPHGIEQVPHLHVFDNPYRFVGLTLSRIVWAVQRYYALEFQSWAPLCSDAKRLRFGRVIVRGTKWERVREAADVLRRALSHTGLHSIGLLDGMGGIALWIPLADAPEASVMRTFLQTVCDRLITMKPNLLAPGGKAASEDRIQFDVSCNALRRCTTLPYSLVPNIAMWHSTQQFSVCTPIEWHELHSSVCIPAATSTIQPRIAAKGDIFTTRLTTIGPQRFEDARL
jgi:DNA primase